MNKYVFDSNVFINLHQRYPMDIFPMMWNVLERLVKEGTVISSQEVYDELLVGGDELVKWVKKRKTSFYATTPSIQEKARQILSSHRGLIEGGKKMNSADPFVIALAMSTQRVLVTDESPTRNPLAPKIPDVCEAYKIPCVTFIEFAREEKLKFTSE